MLGIRELTYKNVYLLTTKLSCSDNLNSKPSLCFKMWNAFSNLINLLSINSTKEIDFNFSTVHLQRQYLRSLSSFNRAHSFIYNSDRKKEGCNFTYSKYQSILGKLWLFSLCSDVLLLVKFILNVSSYQDHHWILIWCQR